MQTLLGIALRSAVVYVYLLIVVRLAGKRTIAEGTPFDLVVALIISDFPDDIIWGDVPVAQGIVAISTIMLAHLIVVWSVAHSQLLERIVDSNPTPLVAQSKLIHKKMEFERVNRTELDSLLREWEIEDLEQVDTARLEPSGNLTVKRTERASAAQKRDLAELQKGPK